MRTLQFQSRFILVIVRFLTQHILPLVMDVFLLAWWQQTFWMSFHCCPHILPHHWMDTRKYTGSRSLIFSDIRRGRWRCVMLPGQPLSMQMHSCREHSWELCISNRARRCQQPALCEPVHAVACMFVTLKHARPLEPSSLALVRLQRSVMLVVVELERCARSGRV